MIRTETEYKDALRRLEEAKRRVADHRTKLEAQGLSHAELKRATDPLRSFYLQVEEELEEYGRLKRGDLGELTNMEGLGRALVGLRIAGGLTQRQLAERLGVHESQVSRDERNEYHGITVERAVRILDAMDVTMSSSFDRSKARAAEDPPPRPYAKASPRKTGASARRRGSAG
jgi:DNA-binding XRE family transcriptional regulator